VSRIALVLLLIVWPLIADGVRVRRNGGVEEIRNVKVLSDDWRGVRVQDGPAVRTFAAEDVVDVIYTVAPPLWAAATTFVREGRIEEAEAALREVAEADPAKWPWAADAAWHRLALIAEAGRRPIDAERAWRTLVEKASEGRHVVDAWRRLVVAAVARRKSEDVERIAAALGALAAKGGSEAAALAFESAAWNVRAATLRRAASAVTSADALAPSTPGTKARARLERALARDASAAVTVELRGVATDAAASDLDVATARVALARQAFDARRDEDVVAESGWLFSAPALPIELQPLLAEALVLAGKSSRRLVDANIDPEKRRLWWDRAIDFHRRAADIAWDVPAVDEARRLYKELTAPVR